MKTYVFGEYETSQSVNTYILHCTSIVIIKQEYISQWFRLMRGDTIIVLSITYLVISPYITTTMIAFLLWPYHTIDCHYNELYMYLGLLITRRMGL